MQVAKSKLGMRKGYHGCLRCRAVSLHLTCIIMDIHYSPLAIFIEVHKFLGQM